jgi:hypothetical protein
MAFGIERPVMVGEVDILPTRLGMAQKEKLAHGAILARKS